MNPDPTTSASFDGRGSMRAPVVHLYHFDETAPLTCPVCGWEGTGADADRNSYSDVFDLCCPACSKMLVVVPRVLDIELVKREAALGNPRAFADMDMVRLIEAHRERFEREHLRSPEQLPEVDGEQLAFEWDYDGDMRDSLITICGHLVWREPTVYDKGAKRFNEVEELMRERYGRRFASLTPTERSKLLHGEPR
jgi:hypothetical protein